jgi:hypothetical protein
MGTEEEELSSAKRQLYYAIVGLLFINIPGAIYKAVKRDGSSLTLDGRPTGTAWTNTSLDGNIFFDFFNLGTTLNENII